MSGDSSVIRPGSPGFIDSGDSGYVAPNSESTPLLRGRSVQPMQASTAASTVTNETPTVASTAAKSSSSGMNALKAVGKFFAKTLVAIPVTFTAAILTGLFALGAIVYETVRGNKKITLADGMVYSVTMLSSVFKILSLKENEEGKTYNWRNTIVDGKAADGRKTGALVLGAGPTMGTPFTSGDFKSIKEELSSNGEQLHVIDLTSPKERVRTLFFGKPAEKADWEGVGATYTNSEAPDFAPLGLAQIDELVEEMHDKISQGINVYIHCAKGVGRSGTIVAAYMAKYGEKSSTKEAIKDVKGLRQISVNEKQQTQIYKYAAMSEIIDSCNVGDSEAGAAVAALLKHAIESPDGLSSLEIPPSLPEKVKTSLQHLKNSGIDAKREESPKHLTLDRSDLEVVRGKVLLKTTLHRSYYDNPQICKDCIKIADQCKDLNDFQIHKILKFFIEASANLDGILSMPYPDNFPESIKPAIDKLKQDLRSSGQVDSSVFKAIFEQILIRRTPMSLYAINLALTRGNLYPLNWKIP